MHCHLSHMANGPEVAAAVRQRGIALLDATLAPSEYPAACERFAAAPNVRVASGLHPWRIEAGPAGEKTAALAAAQAAAHEFVGEVGLDFSRAHASTRAAQLCAFDRIVAACAAQPRAGRVVSIHAVHAATEALDILERHGLPAHATCIFHWFSGSGEDLNRLRALGCLVSVNECMLATRRGRAYARQLPEDALLLETDAPAWLDAPCSAAELEASLAHTLSLLAEIRGTSTQTLAPALAETSVRLLRL